MHSDVLRGRVRTAHPARSGNVAANDVEAERAASEPIINMLIAGDAALADWVEELRRSSGRRGDFIRDPEFCRAGGKQLVPRVVIRLGLHRRRGLLLTRRE